MKVSIESNLTQLNTAIQQYAILGRKTVEEALRKQAGKLGFMLRQELRGIAPAKGSIRAQALAVLAGGRWPSGKRGIQVRPGVLKKVYQAVGASSLLSTGQKVFGGKRLKASTLRGGKRVHLWALAVKAEIDRRESGRGFLGISARYFGLTSTVEGEVKALSKYGPVLSKVGFSLNQSLGTIEFRWSDATSQLSGEAAEGISKAKGDAAVNRALVNTLEDIEVYIDRKLSEGWSR